MTSFKAFLVILFVVTPCALAIQNKYVIRSATEASQYAVRINALKARYTSKDPAVAKRAYDEVNAMATDFQRYYKRAWSAQDRTSRLAAFTTSLWQIATINAASPKTGWWAAITSFTDISDEEFLSKYTMYDFKEPKLVDRIVDIPLKITKTVDWKAVGKVTSIKQQGGCGSCWAFAAIAATTSRYLINKGLTNATYTIDLSEQQILDCVSPSNKDISGLPYDSTGCSGGYSDEVFDYMRQNNVTEEENYPYTGMQTTCVKKVLTSSGTPARVLRIDPPNPGYYQVTSNNVTALKQAVAYTPVAVYLRTESSFKQYSGGIYSTACTGTKLTHALVIYGYTEPVVPGMFKPHWFLKNSWGTGWGEAGFGRFFMDTSSNGLNSGLCGIHKYAYYPNPSSTFTPPKIT